jgi:serine phosphatase RsbU (regulator of sigma subunit)
MPLKKTADGSPADAPTGREVGSAPESEQTPPKAARVLAVGVDLSGRGWDRVDDGLVWQEAGVDEALALLSADPPDVVLLDGAAAETTLAPLLELISTSGRSSRPAVLVVTSRFDALLPEKLRDQVDDFVHDASTPDWLRARLRAALRLRGFVTELSRKNTELETLYARLESLAGRMAEELRLASNIQRSLMPPPPDHPHLEIAREFIPFREIGGDFYDLVMIDANRLAFAIGDVMGKGVPAALLAASLKACLRARLLSGSDSISEILEGVNRVFWEVSPPGVFATLFFALFDMEHGKIDYVNAGHHYPFVVRPVGDVEDLVEGGTVLGLLESCRYKQATLTVEAGDMLVFYSDGVTDRENNAAEAFGVERLKQAALGSRHDEARIALYTLLGDIQGWSAGKAPDDDMTLVVTRVR